MDYFGFYFFTKGDYSYMNIMLLFKYGPISFELMGIFGFSVRYTSPKNKCDQQAENKTVLKELLCIPFKFEIKKRNVYDNYGN